MSDKTRICPTSGVELHRDVRPAEIRYGGRSETVMLPGWYPPEGCDVAGADSIHTGADLRESDEALKRLKAQAQQTAEALEELARLDQKDGLI